MITASRVATGLALAALLAALGACAGGNATSSLAGPATASAATAPATAAPAPAAPAPAAPATADAAPQHLTKTEINEKCWMRTEKFKADNLDKRMKMVDQCVDEMTRAQGGT